jgi:hypothetical protein
VLKLEEIHWKALQNLDLQFLIVSGLVLVGNIDISAGILIFAPKSDINLDPIQPNP